MIKKLLAVLLILSIIIIAGCSSVEKKPTMNKTNAISLIKSTACNKADEAGTCFTKLMDLGIVTPEECCQQMNKCCGGK